MNNNTYKEIEEKTDCLLHNGIKAGKGCCKGLKELYCKKEICKFYKPDPRKQIK